MVVDKWYEIFTENNEEPIAYIMGETKAKLYKDSFDSLKYENLRDTAINLEFKLIKECTPKGYFKYKNHAEKFNQEILKGKGIISPNPKYIL